MLSLLSGFAASIAHVVTGPDHLAAVTPLAIDSRKKSWLVGFSWGAGHTLGMILIGLLFVAFRELIPVESLEAHSDRLIGILLIAVGVWALVRLYRRHTHPNRPHAHFHSHPYLYAHIHSHTHVQPHAPLNTMQKAGAPMHLKGKLSLANPERDHGHEHPFNSSLKKNVLTALLIGLVHGFAGFSHLFALLPTLAMPSRFDSVTYVLAFATGTILTMVIFAFILGRVAFRLVAGNRMAVLRGISLAGAMLAIGVGIFWLLL
jgi:ABC-type nickel/cobalt efflux system permease component RcnA